MAKKRGRVTRESVLELAADLIGEHCEQAVIVLPDTTAGGRCYPRIIYVNFRHDTIADGLLKEANIRGETREQAERYDRENAG